MVPIALGTLDFAVFGSVDLVGIATSHTNPAISAAATASISLSSRLGLSAGFDPGVKVIPLPGTADFLLLVNNTGNVEDSYEATITGTNGPVTASLAGLDGQATQTIPVFRLPALATGAILLNTNLTGSAAGTVTVQVKSLTNSAVVATAMATVSVTAPVVPPTTPPTPPPPPASRSGADGFGAGPGAVPSSRHSAYRDEAGVFLLDANGRIDGLAPGDPGFLARALTRRLILRVAAIVREGSAR